MAPYTCECDQLSMYGMHTHIHRSAMVEIIKRLHDFVNRIRVLPLVARAHAIALSKRLPTLRDTLWPFWELSISIFTMSMF